REQAGDGGLGLLEAPEAHALEDALGLRELDVAVVDDLPVVAPRVEEVVGADHADARVTGAPHHFRLVVDHEPVVARGHRLGHAPERDELVPEGGARHPAAAATKLDPVHDAPEQLEHLVDVADLDRDMVDADEPGHYSGLSAHTPASSTMVAAAAAMSCTLAHSRT